MASASADGEPESDHPPRLDLTGLALELERLDEIRDYFRQTKATLFSTEMNTETVKALDQDHHYVIIQALLHRAATVEGHPSPHVSQLREELTTLYQNCSVVVGDDAVHTDAWCIRKILAFIKMKVRRSKVSTATQLELRDKHFLFAPPTMSSIFPMHVYIWCSSMYRIIISKGQKKKCFERTCTHTEFLMLYILISLSPLSEQVFIYLPSSAIKVYRFQQMCLLLNPFLQAELLTSGGLCFFWGICDWDIKKIRWYFWSNGIDVLRVANLLAGSSGWHQSKSCRTSWPAGMLGPKITHCFLKGSIFQNPLLYTHYVFSMYRV